MPEVQERLDRWQAIGKAMKERRDLLRLDPENPVISTLEDLVRAAMSSSRDARDNDLQFAILELILKHELYYEGSFYTDEEWRSRESYGEGANFLMACEGDVCHALYYETNRKAQVEFFDLVDRHGYTYTFMHCWSLAFYREDIDD